MPVSAAIAKDLLGRDVLRITPPPKHPHSPACMPQVAFDVVITDPDALHALRTVLQWRNNCFGQMALRDWDVKKAEAVRAALNKDFTEQTIGQGNAVRKDVGVRLLLDTVKGNDYMLTLRFDPRVWGDMPDNLKIRDEVRFKPLPPRPTPASLPLARKAADTAPVPPIQPRPAFRPAPPPIVTPPPAVTQIQPPEGRSNAALRPVNDVRIYNLPLLSVEGDVAEGTAELVVKPRARHVGQGTIRIAIKDAVQESLLKAACSIYGSVPVPFPLAGQHSERALTFAAHAINNQLAEHDAGMLLQVYRSLGDRVVMRFDGHKWGDVPKALAIKGTLPSQQPGYQPPLPVMPRLPPIVKKIAKSTISPRIVRRGEQQDLFLPNEPTPAVVRKKTKVRRRIVKVDSRQLKLPIVLEEDAKQGEARLHIVTGDLNAVSLKVTPRQAQLFRLVGDGPRCSMRALQNSLGEPVIVKEGEDPRAAASRAAVSIKAELAALDRLLVNAVSAAAPAVIPPSKVATTKIIAFGNDVFKRHRGVTFKVPQAA